MTLKHPPKNGKNRNKRHYSNISSSTLLEVLQTSDEYIRNPNLTTKENFESSVQKAKDEESNKKIRRLNPYIITGTGMVAALIIAILITIQPTQGENTITKLTETESSLVEQKIDCNTVITSCIFRNTEGFEINFEFGPITTEYNSICAYGGNTGLYIKTDTTSGPYAGWGIQFLDMIDGYADVSEYGELVLWTKGINNTRSKFRIGLKDIQGRETKFEVITTPDQWQEIRLPLSNFTAKGTNISQLENISLDFNSTDHGPAELCLDNLELE